MRTHTHTYTCTQVITVSETEQPDVLKAAQVSLGMLGVISEVTIKVEKAFKLKEILTVNDLDYCMDNLDKLVQEDGYRYVKMWIEFYHNFCVLFQTDKTEDPIGGLPGPIENFFTVSGNIFTILPPHTCVDIADHM